MKSEKEEMNQMILKQSKNTEGERVSFFSAGCVTEREKVSEREERESRAEKREEASEKRQK